MPCQPVFLAALFEATLVICLHCSHRLPVSACRSAAGGGFRGCREELFESWAKSGVKELTEHPPALVPYWLSAYGL